MTPRNTDSRPAATSPKRSAVDERRFYRLVIESVVDYAIFALDPTGHVLTWNLGAERLKGYRASEIIGRHFSTFYEERDLRAGKPEWELEQAKRAGRVEDEGWRVRKDGSRFWANVVITALHDEDGTLVGFGKVTRDLTGRRNAEEQARQLAAEQAAHGASREYTRQLEELNERLQQQAAELESQTEEAQALAEEAEQANQQLQDSLAEVEEAREMAQEAERQTRFLVRAGDVLTASLDYATNLRELAHLVVPELADWCSIHTVDENGTIEQLEIAHRDPSKVELARELNVRYPQDPDATTGVPQVVRTGRPELFTEVPTELLERTARDAQHLRIIKSLDLRSAMIVPLLARGRVLGALSLVSAESGRRYSQADLDFTMELARRAALAVDNARLHGQALGATREAEQAAAAKTRFLAIMSHELRTPLNAIGGYAELLATGVRGAVSDQQRKDLERIKRNQLNLLALVNDVLDYAKLDSDRMEYRAAAVNVRNTLAEIDATILPELRLKGLEYDYSACDEKLTVQADPDRFRQILLNLLSNAVKFTPSGGKVIVSCEMEGAETRVKVTDTGIGIAADQIESIFEPFVQLDRNLTRQEEGTGLGLSISRDLAREMGGDLVCESRVGSGSTFTVTLPSAESV